VTETVTTAEAIARSLISHGVDTVFGIPGVQTYPLFDAMARAGIRVIGARHEQGAGYMAFGYAQATGRAGVYCVVPGPGFLNASAALISAFGASAPVVCITGEIPSAYVGRGLGHLHELPDQLATMRSLTKWAAAIEHPAQAAELTARAFYHARSGRPRPVAIAVPWDVLAASAPADDVPPVPVTPPPLDHAAVARAADVLAGAENPMIMVGGGARDAAAEVAELARLLQAPVVSHRGGRGIAADDDPYGFTSAAGFRLWPRTDVLLGIGSRLELAWFRWPRRPDPPAGGAEGVWGERFPPKSRGGLGGIAPPATTLRTVLIDIDPAQPVRLRSVRLRPEVAVVADARQAAGALAAELRRRGAPRPDRSAEFRAVKRQAAADFRDVGADLDYLAAIRAALPADGFFVEEICQAGFASYFGFPVTAPRQFVTCGYQGTLGFGYPTALGVKAAFPDRAVVSVAGDGGFMFGIGELAAAVQHRLGVVAVVFNNDAYGNVLLDQQRLYAGREVGARLHNPDFAAAAGAFGAAGYTVRSPGALQETLAKALADGSGGRPAVIEVKTGIGGTASPWKYLMPGWTSTP
jgi:acetolactate synthase-1/2/3 large subunit